MDGYISGKTNALFADFTYAYYVAFHLQQSGHVLSRVEGDFADYRSRTQA
jgi:hypothetical protein